MQLFEYKYFVILYPLLKFFCTTIFPYIVANNILSSSAENKVLLKNKILPGEFRSTFSEPLVKKCQHFSKIIAPQLMQSALGNEFLQLYLVQHKAAVHWSVRSCPPWRYAAIEVRRYLAKPQTRLVSFGRTEFRGMNRFCALYLAPTPHVRLITTVTLTSG